MDSKADVCFSQPVDFKCIPATTRYRTRLENCPDEGGVGSKAGIGWGRKMPNLIQFCGFDIALGWKTIVVAGWKAYRCWLEGVPEWVGIAAGAGWK